MPGISERAERSVSLRRRLRWKLMAKRWASSRSCCRMNISALLLRIGMASLAWGRNTRSGFVAAPASRAPFLAFLEPFLEFFLFPESLLERHVALLGQRDDRQPDTGAGVDPDVARGGERHRQLPFAAVDDDEVGQLPGSGVLAPLARPPEAAREDLVHRGEIVVVAAAARRARGADLVGPVAALVGSAVDEHHHRGDGGEPL